MGDRSAWATDAEGGGGPASGLARARPAGEAPRRPAQDETGGPAEEDFHPVWEDPNPRGAEDDRALARMLGWAMLVGLGLWILLGIALL